ncbi:MAG: choice-of-anchor D domain-containing protein [Pyrinomonadaceae bacterium]
MLNNRRSFRFSIYFGAIAAVFALAVLSDLAGISDIFGLRATAQEIESSDEILSPSALAYTRSSFTSAYTPITVAGGATQINGGTGTGDFSSSSGSADVNDGTAYVPLPFNFTYDGVNQTAGTNFLGICTNGYAYFSASNLNSTKITTSAKANLFSANAPNSTLAPYWDNLIANTAVNGITGTVLFQTVGSAPNRVLTVQWGNYPSSTSFARGVNFQIKIYEGTNVVEFHYGPVVEGTIAGGNANESPAIGIENAVGGNNNYLDALTGSSQTNTTMMTSSKFPKNSFRFTPGAPVAIPAGTYNVGIGQQYPNLSEAVIDMNQRGISGPVTLNLTDSNYDNTAANGGNFFPVLLGPVAGNSAANSITIGRTTGTATLTADGYGNNGTVGNQLVSSVISNTASPIFGVVGADFVTLRNLNFTVTPGNLTALSGSNADIGLLVFSSSGTDGATNNVFRDLSFSLDRANRDTQAIFQFAPFAPNSSNKYYNLTISNTYTGVFLDGGSTPDSANEVGVTGGVTRNAIGGANSNDIGNGATQAWGIRARNQNGVKIFNNEIRNITATGSLPVDGIILDNAGSGTVNLGSNEISGNVIHDLNNPTVAVGNGAVTGIRESLTNNAGSVSNVFNNTIYNLNSSSTATATRRIIGIWSQDTFTAAASTHNIQNNSVRIAPTNLLTSNSAFEISSTTPTFNVRNNIFANFTGAQVGVASHYAWVSTSSSSIGGAGTVSDFNDLYINNTTNGFVGRGASTDFATLANWQTILAGAGPDDNSISSNPLFASPTDLHLTLLSPTIDKGTTVASILFDIDADPRPRGLALAYDIGSDETIPEMNVKGLNVSISDGDGTPSGTDDTDFGLTQVNGGIVSHVFTIENSGIAVLNLSGTPRVAISGPNAADFSVTVQPDSPVAADSGTTSFVVFFDPSAGGSRSATVAISNDDTNEAPYDFAITGTGIAPEMDVRGLNNSIPDGDTTPALADDTDFGSVNATGGTASHVFTVANTGLADLILSGNPRVAVSGPSAADFAITVQPNSPVAPAGTTTFTVVFDPAAVGVSSATLTIASDDLDENPYDFAIRGTGIIPSAIATITGRVTTPTGLGLRNAVVILTDSQNVRRTATTSSFGIYSFTNVSTGQSYTLGVSSKRYRFAPAIVNISADLTVDFVGLE